MAVDLVTVTGNIETLTGATPSLSRIWFKLNRPSWNLAGDIFAPEYTEAIASAGGAFSVALQSTDDLENGASYSAILRYREPLDGKDREYTLSTFLLPTGGPYQLGDLLSVPFVEPVPEDILELATAAALRAESASERILGPNALALRREARLNFGFNGVTDTQIFPNAERASQGLAIAEIGGVKNWFVLQRVAGSTFLTDERQRIVFGPLVGNDQDTTPTTWTAELALGHQGLSHFYQAGALKLVSQNRTVTGHTGTDAGKGISVITWNGAATVDADVDNYQLFGDAGSGHPLESFYGATSAVTPDGRTLVMVALDTNGGGGIGEDIQDSTNWLLVYDLQEVLAAADPLDVAPKLIRQLLQPDRGDGLQYTQGVACDGNSIWVLRGYLQPQGRQQIIRYSMLGEKTQVIDSDFARAAYSFEDLRGSAGVIGVSFEPEGLALDDGELVGLFLDNRRTIGSTVTFEGKTWSAIATTLVDGTYYSPRNANYWIETPTATPSGAWVDGVSYAPGAYTRRRKTLWRVAEPVDGATDEYPLSRGLVSRDSGGSVFLNPNEANVVIEDGETLQTVAFSYNTQAYYSLMHLQGGKHLRLFDARPGADNAVYGQWGMNTVAGRQISEMRGPGGTLATAGAINLYGISDTEAPHETWLGAGGVWHVKLDANGFKPGETRGLPVMIYSSAVPVAHTGTTAKTAIRTVSIPGNALGPNGFLTVEFEAYTADNTVNNKIVTLEYGGTIIHETAADGLDSTRNYGQQIWMHNANSNSAQTFRAIGAANAYGTSTSTGARSGTVNSAVAQNLVLSFTLGLGTETISLQRFTVYATYQP